MRNRWMSAIALGLALGGLMISAAGAQTGGQLQIEGSTTVGPIVDAFAEAFMRSHQANITVKKTGSGDGAAALVDRRADVASMSRFMRISEFQQAVANGVMPVAHAVAMDGIAIVVHPSNPVSNLSREQVRAIFAGQITNWSQLGGPNAGIVAISRDTSSGTYEVFHELVMNKGRMADGVEYVNSNPQAYARVRSTSGAIGYVGLGFLTPEVKALQIEGVTPSRTTIATGRYPIARALYLFTNGYPEPGTLLFDFVTFHLTERGQEAIESKGFVPFTNY